VRWIDEFGSQQPDRAQLNWRRSIHRLSMTKCLVRFEYIGMNGVGEKPITKKHQPIGLKVAVQPRNGSRRVGLLEPVKAPLGQNKHCVVTMRLT
jgi:hypothetical protein